MSHMESRSGAMLEQVSFAVSSALRAELSRTSSSSVLVLSRFLRAFCQSLL